MSVRPENILHPYFLGVAELSRRTAKSASLKDGTLQLRTERGYLEFRIYASEQGKIFDELDSKLFISESSQRALYSALSSPPFYRGNAWTYITCKFCTRTGNRDGKFRIYVQDCSFYDGPSYALPMRDEALAQNGLRPHSAGRRSCSEM